MKTLLVKKNAEVGELIRAYHHGYEPNGSYFQGVVTKVTTHPEGGYECVEYTAIKMVSVNRSTGEVTHEENCFRRMRCPQNGVPTSLGEITDNIRVFKEVA